jgi:hypothetical protein
MVQIDTVHDDVVEIRPSTVLPAAATIDITAMATNPKIRRWESAPKSTTGSWIPLERGVEVDFENARSYRTGEYWSLPARTAINDLLWPRTGTTPDLRRPAGPDHRYTKLAVLSFDGTAWTVLDDCRELFPPLTDLVTMRYAGGDGQHAAPDPANAATLVALSEPLRVAVANGNHPLAGRDVEFTVVAGNGRVDNGSGPAAVALAVTGADGVASVAWSVDSGTDPQEVVARLLTSSGADVDVPVTFSATCCGQGGSRSTPARARPSWASRTSRTRSRRCAPSPGAAAPRSSCRRRATGPHRCASSLPDRRRASASSPASTASRTPS